MLELPAFSAISNEYRFRRNAYRLFGARELNIFSYVVCIQEFGPVEIIGDYNRNNIELYSHQYNSIIDELNKKLDLYLEELEETTQHEG